MSGNKSNRGFASMDEARQREIASKGGQSVPDEKRSFSQNHELAAQSGRKGGQNVAPEDRSFSRDRGLAAEAGRKGGQASQSSQAAKSARQARESGFADQPKAGVEAGEKGGEAGSRDH